MPEVSRFFGITIAMYYNDHSPPHFHAKYGDDQASLRIDNGAILEGNWAREHADLLRNGAPCIKRNYSKTGRARKPDSR